MERGDKLQPGTRVELHPATDAWMMGDRFGEVERQAGDVVRVKMDRSGKTRRVHITNIGKTL